MAKSEFENLQVYQLAEELSDRIWDIVAEWDHFAKNTVGQQLVRAVDSIGANIAEGNGRRDTKDNRRFVRIAWGSLNETQHFLRRAYKRDLIKKENAEVLAPIVEMLGPKLNAYHRSLTPKDSQ
ncbi:MAG: four helix bundle protein [Kiritimatiellales bacterium]|jgi:four helix bundle protein